MKKQSNKLGGIILIIAATIALGFLVGMFFVVRSFMPDPKQALLMLIPVGFAGIFILAQLYLIITVLQENKTSPHF